jgi:hypothetical protein
MTSLLGARIVDGHVKLPLRLIHIPSDPSVGPRLVLSGGQYGSYAALSYCWGPPQRQPLKTTKRNLDSHLRALPASRIPKTFSDAFTVLRAIGLEYAWIDSLCIIQDSLEDWQEQAAEMASVYQNASIVLAATDSSDSHEGLFRQIHRRVIELPYLPETPMSNTKGSILVVQEFLPDIIEHSPLARRGWATQEWMLARRLVHFRDSRLIWKCARFKYGISDDNNTYVLSDDLRSKDNIINWERVVFWYSARQLTFIEDRLVAIQGLANEVTLHGKSPQYSFGIWARGLPHELLWHGYTNRPKRIQALSATVPSWSWGSRDGGMNYLNFNDGRESLCSAEIQATELTIRCCGKDVSRLDLHRMDRISHVLDTHSVLVFAVHYLVEKPIRRKYYYCFLDAQSNVHGWVLFDTENIPGGSISCLQISKLVTEHAFKEEFVGMLVVQENPRCHGKYRRVGIGLTKKLDWFAGAVERAFVVT